MNRQADGTSPRARLQTDPCLFVFQEPLSRTNIPQAELIALIELAAPTVCFEEIDLAKMTEQTKRPGYFTSDDDARVDLDHPIVRIAFLEQSAILVANFELDLANLVGRSGYLQSAGHLVFLCEWGALDGKEVVDLLVHSAVRHKARFPLEFYRKSTHEQLMGNLEHLDIDDSRYHFGREPFQPAADRVLQEYDQRCTQEGLDLTGPGHLFLYRDSAAMADRRKLDGIYPDRSDTDFAVCYLSKFKKDNIVHALDAMDEGKPYWAGIFTTPHRLINAMLNLAHVREGDRVVDPFCHTGTTAIEAAFCGASVVAADKHEPQGAADNFALLCQGASQLHSLTVELAAIAGDDSVQDGFNDLAFETIHMNPQGLPEVRDGMGVERLGELARQRGIDFSDLPQRLFFYLVRRYQMQRQRGVREKHPDARTFVMALCGSDAALSFIPENAPVTYFEVARLLAIYEEAKGSSGIPVVAPTPATFRDHRFMSQRVGHVASPPSTPRFIARDILKDDDYEIAPGSVDAVVTDPPYGYGEAIGSLEVAKIYRRLFAKSVKWLRHGGQLVFCTLDKVRTGRTEDLLFTEDILGILNEVLREGRVAIAQRHVFPVSHWPPFLYYWKSKHALNRAVVAIEILKEKL